MFSKMIVSNIKALITMTFIGLLMTSGMWVLAQSNVVSNPAKEKPAASSSKKEVVQDKKTVEERASTELKTDAQNRSYKMVDGRKVLTDNQGIQSLSVPQHDPGKKIEPEKNK